MMALPYLGADSKGALYDIKFGFKEKSKNSFLNS